MASGYDRKTDLEKWRRLTLPDLKKSLGEARVELAKRREEAALGKLTDRNQPRYLRRQISRQLTVIREKEILAEADKTAADGADKAAPTKNSENPSEKKGENEN